MCKSYIIYFVYVCVVVCVKRTVETLSQLVKLHLKLQVYGARRYTHTYTGTQCENVQIIILIHIQTSICTYVCIVYTLHLSGCDMKMG